MSSDGRLVLSEMGSAGDLELKFSFYDSSADSSLTGSIFV
jgi:hypothetical protein